MSPETKSKTFEQKLQDMIVNFNPEYDIERKLTLRNFFAMRNNKPNDEEIESRKTQFANNIQWITEKPQLHKPQMEVFYDLHHPSLDFEELLSMDISMPEVSGFVFLVVNQFVTDMQKK